MLCLFIAVDVGWSSAALLVYANRGASEIRSRSLAYTPAKQVGGFHTYFSTAIGEVSDRYEFSASLVCLSFARSLSPEFVDCELLEDLERGF